MIWTFGHIDFSTYPHYNNEKLGVNYSSEQTIIRLWAPTADRVVLKLYKSGDCEEAFNTSNLKKNEKVWEACINGDQHGIYYTIQCLINQHWMEEVPDPYAYAVGVNGKRGMICNFGSTNPTNWSEDKRVLPEHYTDMILYELHVRDFSIDEYSGISNKGKFLGFTEEGTKSPEGVKTGIDHLVEMGITHVHLLPIYDFFTVDEAHPEKNEYNWGYDPQNFNALEGSYSSNPFDGANRIKEFKLLVQALHKKGIGVIMDVVYNHTGLINSSSFNQTVPGYFYRQRSDGRFSDASGCGTEIASERSMVRKYMIDSLKFWADEYHLDGFRFDLMGVLDIKTMNSIRTELDKINSKLVLYGEGWTAAESPLKEKVRAVKKNTNQLNGIAVFNDDFRNAMKGHWGSPNSLGYASGLTLNEESIKLAITGGNAHPQINFDFIENSHKPWTNSPQQSINYISCHDNYTFYDKLKLSRPDASLNELAQMQCLAGAVLLTSQGIPFLHAGVEMLRTKKGHGNTYKSGDEYNLIDWSRKAMFSYVTEYYKKLISLRKKHPAFRMKSVKQIQKHIQFSDHYMPGVVAYKIGEFANGDTWKNIQIIFNNNTTPIIFPVEKCKWTEIANGYAFDEDGLTNHQSHTVFVQACSMLLLVAE
ncbi:MAG: type I pullulanase [Prolixibacteraceae bacterium]|jgi:pullulanase|nr:type I pullulanase [Prolixibacteraceae bacterium]